MNPSKLLAPHDFARVQRHNFADEPHLTNAETFRLSWRKDPHHILWPGIAVVGKSHHAMDEQDQTVAAEKIIADLQRDGEVQVAIDRSDIDMTLSVRSLNTEQVKREWQHKMFSVVAGRLSTLHAVQKDVQLEFENLVLRLKALPGGQGLDGAADLSELEKAKKLARIGLEEEDFDIAMFMDEDSAEMDGTKVAELCFPNVIQRMVQIVRDNINPSTTQRFAKTLSSGTDKTVLRVVRILTTLITLQAKASNKGKTRQSNIEAMQEQIFLVGGLKMVIDLIAVGIPRKLMLTAIKFGITLLKRQGGYRKAQQEASVYLKSGQLTAFFVGVQDQLNWSAGQVTMRSVRINSRKAMERQGRPMQVVLGEGEGSHDADDEDVCNLHLMEFLRLLCVGKYHPNQLLMQSQPGSEHSINICEALAHYLANISMHLKVHVTNLKAANAAIRLIHDFVAGPCHPNQRYLACDTDLLDDTNQLLRHIADRSDKVYLMGDPGKELEMKYLAALETRLLTMLHALIEGWREGETQVHDRLLAVLKFDTLGQRLGSLLLHLREDGMSSAQAMMPYRGRHKAGLERWKRAERNFILGSQIVALFLALGDCDPGWLREMKEAYKRNIKFFQYRMNYIEVRWRKRVHKVHFLVPNLCMYFRNLQSQFEAMDKIDCYNHSEKLLAFVEVSTVLYEEMKHSRYLYKRYLSYVCTLLWLHRFEKAVFYMGFAISFLFGWILRIQEGVMIISAKNTLLQDFVGSDCSLRWIVSVFAFLLALICVFRAASKITLSGPILRFKTGSWVRALFSSEIYSPVAYVVMTSIGCVNLVRRELVPCMSLKDEAERFKYIKQYSETALFPMFYTWFSFLMLDMINHSSSVQETIKTVFVAKKAFILTLIFLFLIIGMFAFGIFETLFDRVKLHANHEFCKDFWTCIFFSLFTGPRMSGGVADAFIHYDPYDRTQLYRWEMMQLASFVYFTIINLIGLNLLLGIMIDTFAKIRSDNERKREANANHCFICNIKRRTFVHGRAHHILVTASTTDSRSCVQLRVSVDCNNLTPQRHTPVRATLPSYSMRGPSFEISTTTTFKDHKEKYHNVVAYTDFFVHTQEKNIDDLTGIEAHVLQRIRSKQIDWFPLEHAGDLNKQDADSAGSSSRVIVLH